MEENKSHVNWLRSLLLDDWFAYELFEYLKLSDIGKFDTVLTLASSEYKDRWIKCLHRNLKTSSRKFKESLISDSFLKWCIIKDFGLIFNTLSLDAVKYDLSELVIRDLLCTCPNIKSLQIHCNRFGYIDVNKVIMGTKVVHNLDDPKYSYPFGEFISIYCPKIERLELLALSPEELKFTSIRTSGLRNLKHIKIECDDDEVNHEHREICTMHKLAMQIGDLLQQNPNLISFEWSKDSCFGISIEILKYLSKLRSVENVILSFDFPRDISEYKFDDDSKYLPLARSYINEFTKSCSKLKKVGFFVDPTDDDPDGDFLSILFEALGTNSKVLEEFELSMINLSSVDSENHYARLIQTFSSGCPLLKSLIIENSLIFGDIDIKYLVENCPELVRIHIDQHFSNQGLMELSKLKKLKDINIPSYWISNTLTDIGIKYLVECNHNIEYLNLANCGDLTDESLTSIAINCPNLKCMTLSSNNQNFTKIALKKIMTDCKNLEKSCIRSLHNEFDIRLVYGNNSYGIDDDGDDDDYYSNGSDSIDLWSEIDIWSHLGSGSENSESDDDNDSDLIMDDDDDYLLYTGLLQNGLEEDSEIMSGATYDNEEYEEEIDEDEVVDEDDDEGYSLMNYERRSNNSDNDDDEKEEEEDYENGYNEIDEYDTNCNSDNDSVNNEPYPSNSSASIPNETNRKREQSPKKETENEMEKQSILDDDNDNNNNNTIQQQQQSNNSTNNGFTSVDNYHSHTKMRVVKKGRIDHNQDGSYKPDVHTSNNNNNFSSSLTNFVENE